MTSWKTFLRSKINVCYWCENRLQMTLLKSHGVNFMVLIIKLMNSHVSIIGFGSWFCHDCHHSMIAGTLQGEPYVPLSCPRSQEHAEVPQLDWVSVFTFANFEWIFLQKAKRHPLLKLCGKRVRKMELSRVFPTGSHRICTKIGSDHQMGPDTPCSIKMRAFPLNRRTFL